MQTSLRSNFPDQAAIYQDQHPHQHQQQLHHPLLHHPHHPYHHHHHHHQQQEQQQENSNYGDIYHSHTSIYYDLSNNYSNSNGPQMPLDQQVGQHYEHQIKVIELQESYHQQQQAEYCASTDATQEQQVVSTYSSASEGAAASAAVYADPFAQPNCIAHETSYTQEYLNHQTAPSSAYYAPTLTIDEEHNANHDHEQNCYLAQVPPDSYSYTTLGALESNQQQEHTCYMPLEQQHQQRVNYYETPTTQLTLQPPEENCHQTEQIEAGLYQIEYQQLEESRKQHEQQQQQQQPALRENQNIRSAASQQQQVSLRNSFSSALSTSSSCTSANSAKLFSQEDEEASGYGEEEDEEDEGDDEEEDGDEDSEDSTLPRDQKKAKEANIPLSYDEIVNLSIDQFNEHIARFQYTEAQLTLMKDIRRRGKNKVAAQTCRKRKMAQIMELQHEVGQLANKRMALSCDLNRLIQEHIEQANEYERFYTIIQMHMSKSTLVVANSKAGTPSQPSAQPQSVKFNPMPSLEAV